jgi:hypothetical protein
MLIIGCDFHTRYQQIAMGGWVTELAKLLRSKRRTMRGWAGGPQDLRSSLHRSDQVCEGAAPFGFKGAGVDVSS